MREVKRGVSFLLARKLFPDVMPSKFTLDYACIRFSNITYAREEIDIIINSSKRKILEKLLTKLLFCTKVGLIICLSINFNFKYIKFLYIIRAIQKSVKAM